MSTDRPCSATHAKSPQQVRLRNKGFAGPLTFRGRCPRRRRTAMDDDAAPDLTTIPGRRIGHYRNSSRRSIKLYGLGKTGATVARAVGERGLPNVEVTHRQPRGRLEPRSRARSPIPPPTWWSSCAAKATRACFGRNASGRDSLVTFVLLQRQGNLLVVRNDSVSRRARLHRPLRHHLRSRLRRRPDRQPGELTMRGCPSEPAGGPQQRRASGWRAARSRSASGCAPPARSRSPRR